MVPHLAVAVYTQEDIYQAERQENPTEDFNKDIVEKAYEGHTGDNKCKSRSDICQEGAFIGQPGADSPQTFNHYGFGLAGIAMSMKQVQNTIFF